MKKEKWTHFWDMHSRGELKEKWASIYIEAPEQEAKIIFYNRFGHNPERVNCTCCGSDYSISVGNSLSQLTGFLREDQTLKQYLKNKKVLVIYKKDIKDQERIGEVPEQGYV